MAGTGLWRIRQTHMTVITGGVNLPLTAPFATRGMGSETPGRTSCCRVTSRPKVHIPGQRLKSSWLATDA